MYSDDFESFEPVNFLELSKKLYDNREEYTEYSSALKRTIVSRCYYAAFLHIRHWLISHGKYESTKVTDHMNVPNEIVGNIPTMEYVAKNYKDMLITLKRNRQVCDYDFKLPDKNNPQYNLNVEDVIRYSDKLITAFNSFNDL